MYHYNLINGMTGTRLCSSQFSAQCFVFCFTEANAWRVCSII